MQCLQSFACLYFIILSFTIQVPDNQFGMINRPSTWMFCLLTLSVNMQDAFFQKNRIAGGQSR